MSILGNTTIELHLSDCTYEHVVVVVENCSYNFLLGKTFCCRIKRVSTLQVVC